MADETVASGALKKLREIDGQLNDLYQSAEAIKRLEQEFDSLHDRTEQQHQELLQDHDAAFADCEKKHETLSRNFANTMMQLETQKSSLDRAIQQLIQQKDELHSTIESILKGYQNRQKQIDDAIAHLSTQQTDLQSLENKLIKAFSGLDEDIDTKLAVYENKLDAGVAESQTKIDEVLEHEIEDFRNLTKDLKDSLETRFGTLENDVKQNIQQLASVGGDLKSEASTQFENINADLLAFRTEIQQQLNGQEYELNSRLDRHIEDNRQQGVDLKKHLEAALKNVFRQIEDALVQKIDNKLDLIIQDQTRFIERQTVLINNNTQQIDQLQRTFNIQRDEVSQVRQDILSTADHVRQDVSGEIQRSVDSLREEVLKKATKTTWFPFGRQET